MIFEEKSSRQARKMMKLLPFYVNIRIVLDRISFHQYLKDHLEKKFRSFYEDMIFGIQ